MYTGFFEAHITVMLPLHIENTQEIENFKESCHALHIKPIYIELERGDTPVQMMTSSLHEGNFENIKQEVESIAHSLKNKNYQVTRMKIEAHPDNIGVPLQKNQILLSQKQNYFECHFKVLLDRNIENFDQDFAYLKNICEANQAHLSKNAFKYQEKYVEERFITQRIYEAGKNEAYQSFEKLENILKTSNFYITKKIVEYCVFDDNELIDKNWLTTYENSACEICEKIDNCNFSIKRFSQN